MENRPVIDIKGRSPTPWADAEAYKRYREWGDKTRSPMIIAFPQTAAFDSYDVVKENLDYPRQLTITHHKHLSDWKSDAASVQRAQLGEDFKLWIDRAETSYLPPLRVSNEVFLVQL